MNELNLDISDIEKRMSGAITSLKNDFLSLRTGRASSSMLDPVVVEVLSLIHISEPTRL